MADRVETVQGVEKAFGLPPRADTETKEAAAPHPIDGDSLDHEFPLSRPCTVQRVEFSTIRLRPVRVADWLEFGDVEDWQISDGAPFRFQKMDAIRSYMERCISVPAEPSLTGREILLALHLSDALAIKEAILGFFARPPSAASE